MDPILTRTDAQVAVAVAGRSAMAELPAFVQAAFAEVWELVQAGRLEHAVYVGPYDTLGGHWMALFDWITNQGLRPDGPMWESYVDDPATTDPATMRTEIYIPVADVPER